MNGSIQINSMEDLNELPIIGEETIEMKIQGHKIETNIPIYRAKKIDSDEYVEGFYSQGVSRNKATRFATTHIIKLKEIDLSTLAISFDNRESFDSVSDIADIFCDYTPQEVRFKLGLDDENTK